MTNKTATHYFEIRLRAILKEAKESGTHSARVSHLMRVLHADFRKRGHLAVSFPGYVVAENIGDYRRLGDRVRIFGASNRLQEAVAFVKESLEREFVVGEVLLAPETEKKIAFFRFDVDSRSRAKRPKKINGILVEREGGFEHRAEQFQATQGLPFFSVFSTSTRSSFSNSVGKKTAEKKEIEESANIKITSYGLSERGAEAWLPDF